MKISFTIGLVIFWTAIVALAIAGLVSHENQKLYDSLSTTQTGIGQTTSVLGEAEQELIVSSGVSTWTPELVALHSTRKDCWMTIENAIYDVSEYVPFHPGGEQTILDFCGAEATEAFKTKGSTGTDHSASAWSMLENYFVAFIGDELPAGGTRAAQSGTASTQTNQNTTENTQKVASTPQQQTQQAETQTKRQPEPRPSSALTAATVAAHNSTSDCWLIINNKVYDVTQYIPFHPGGTNTITPYCGKESTSAFSTKGTERKDHSQNAYDQLDGYYIGTLGAEATETVAAQQPVQPAEPTPEPEPEQTPTPDPTPAPAGSLTADDVAPHNSVNDCWLIINNKVYDVTQYIPFHPGGTNTITPYCGKEATGAFDSQGHSTNARNQLNGYYLGDFTGGTTGSSGVDISAPADPAEPYREAILAEYPDAIIEKLKVEDDGKAEFKFTLHGTRYEGKMDASYNIIKLEDD